MSLILKYDLGNPHRLPVGYTPLAYIESTGTLYINLGYTYNTFTNLVWDTEFSITLGTGNYLVLFGNRGGGTPYGGQIVVKNDNSGIYFDCGNKTLNFLTTLSFNKKFHTYITLKNGTLSAWFNDIHYADVTGVTSYDTSTQSTLFSQQTSYKACARIYYHRAWKDNVLMVDLIPAKRSDGVIGMFDIVSQTFKTNAGTGAFIAGPEVVVLPYEYLQVEYLEGTGTLWIDTNYLCNADNLLNLKYKLDAMATDTAVGNNWWACGIGGASGIGFHVGIGAGSSAKPFTFARGISDVNTGINGSLNTRYKWELDMVNLTYKVWSESGTSLVDTTFTRLTPTQSQNLALFRWRSYSNSGYIFGMKIYHMELYNTSSLVRNMIPCYRRSDLKPGMYDTVNNVFYTNSGSGEFILGPVVEESSRLLEYNNICSLSELSYDNTVYTESDGSRWVKIFHHNNPAGALFTSSDVFTSEVYKDTNRWFYINLCNYLSGGWEFLAKLKIETSSEEQSWRWVLNYNPMTATWDNVKEANIIRISGYSTWSSGYGGLFRFTSGTTPSENTYLRQANATSSNWFGATGCWAAYQGGIPGFNGTVVKSGYMDIYLRIPDNLLSGLPINIHHSISNPSSTLINLGSGKFVRSEKSMITTGALGISGDANFSICAWVKTVDAVTDYVGIVSSSTYTAGKCFSLLLYSNKPDLDFWTGSGTDGGSRFIATNAISSGEWHHIVATKAAGVPSTSNCKLYVDGIAVPGSVVGSQAPNITNSPIIIGRLNNSTNRYFNGDIYDARVYNNVLTADEVLQIYKGGL